MRIAPLVLQCKQKEAQVNPLLHRDVHRYVKDLVDHHLPNEDNEADFRDGKADLVDHRPNDEQPSEIKKGNTA